MKNFIKTYLILLIIGFFTFGCKTSKVATSDDTKVKEVMPVDYVGDWDFYVENTPVDVSGIMQITKEADGFGGILKSTQGDLPIKKFVIENNKLTGVISVQGMMGELMGDFSGSNYTGVILLDDNEFPMHMKKK